MRRLLPWLGLALLFAGCASRGIIKIVKAQPLPPSTRDARSGQVQVEPLVVIVKKGDCLWLISRRHLGLGSRYPEIVELNALKSEVLQPGQRLQLPRGAVVKAPPVSKPERGLPKRRNKAYALGEKLTFAVQYFNVTGGYATLSITETSEQSGRVCLHVQALAKTQPFFETFFKVRDRIDTYIDAESLVTWRYEKHLHEGGYQADASYVYDQRRHLMLEPDKGTQIKIPPDTQDVLSCFYWFRNLELKVGDVASIPVADDNMKCYDMKVNVLRKERLSTLAGDFDTVVVQPHLLSAGVFQQKGEVFIWLTDDARHIPVKIRSKIVIGNININLQDAEWAEPL